ncbi:Hypothetical predicted protein [Octopus vulgaris]|uniref:Uncharacterized protein n=1 Tax=Octopus vulgaris TaxID=6645 RepID=A0AA36AMT0_OCTVU|nr:Hypothetical predicted protein [Octopus vulgaris]
MESVELENEFSFWQYLNTKNLQPMVLSHLTLSKPYNSALSTNGENIIHWLTDIRTSSLGQQSSNECLTGE